MNTFASPGRIMKVMFVLMGLVFLLDADPAISSSLNFRGLSAAARDVDVRKIFPKVRQQNYCRQGETVSRSAEGETLCSQLTFDGYILDNTAFDINFIFSPDGRLRYISLIKLYGNYRDDEGSVKASVINSTFTSLSDLLSSKYGPAVSDPPGSYLQRGPVNNELEWQPGRGTKWQSGGDRISLKSDGAETRTKLGLFRGSVQIFYRFARRDQFDKF